MRDCQVFKKTSEESQSSDVIKVVNTKYDMSCVWPLSKLKEKLVRMRKLVYAVRTTSYIHAHVLLTVQFSSP